MAHHPASHTTSPGHGTPSNLSDAFTFAQIPIDRRGVADPLHRREDTIDQMLRTQGLGLVVGWGDSLGERRPNGLRPSASMRIDISVNDLPAARSALRTLLPTLGAPAGTEVHYTLAERSLMDLALSTGWQLEQSLPSIKNQLQPRL